MSIAIPPAAASGHTVAVLALNKHEVTDRCLARVRASGFTGPLVLVDNGSTPPLADIAARYGCLLVRNATNRFVNPAWNQLFDLCETRFLTLLNNDCLVRDGYLDEVTGIMASAGLALAAPDGERVPSILDVSEGFDTQTAPPAIDPAAARNGEVMTIDMLAYRRGRYRIPSRLLIWFGDDWIWGQLRLHGFVCARIVNRTCIREASSTIKANPHLQRILDRDARLAYNSPLFSELRVLAGVSPQELNEVWRGSGRVRGAVSRLRDRILFRD